MTFSVPSPQVCRNKGLFSPFDYHFSLCIQKLFPDSPAEVVLFAGLVSRSVQKGHTCLPLEEAERDDALKELAVPPSFFKKVPALLRQASAVGRGGEEFLPLVFKKNALYLQRYFFYESGLAEHLCRRMKKPFEPVDVPLLQEGLARYFPEAHRSSETDWQYIAAALSVLKGTVFISGGPGTGKTTTVLKILLLLAEQWEKGALREEGTNRKPQIFLLSPTGKAATRLRDAMEQTGRRLKEEGFSFPSSFSELIGEPLTLHRFLGMRSDGSCMYRKENPHPADIVIVDEASMIDLPLFYRLLDALPSECRLIVLGDKEQISPVEVGSVFGEICRLSNKTIVNKQKKELQTFFAGHSSGRPEKEVTGVPPAFACGHVHLQKSYRFSESGAIGKLSFALRDGNKEEAFSLLRNDREALPAWREGAFSYQEMHSLLKQNIVKLFSPLKKTDNPAEAFGILHKNVVLTLLNKGIFGTEGVNRVICEGMGEEENTPFHGRPVLITENDYQLMLFNGDIGITLPCEEERSEQKVFFPDGKGGWRSFLPHQLPAHRTAFALTVHKSQGSEYEKVFCILPAESPLLCREVLYTALTRAKKEFELWGSREALEKCITTPARRYSRLKEHLQDRLTEGASRIS